MQRINFEESNYFIFRLIMGMNMMIHGGGRIFGEYQNFLDRMENMFSTTILPGFLVTATANIISPIEFIFGFFLIIGFKTKISILALNSILLVLISGVCLLSKWELAGLQMGYALYLFFLGNFIQYNKVSIDELLEK